MRKIALLFLLCSSLASSGQNKELDSLYNLLSSYRTEDSTKVKLIFNICKLAYAVNRDTIPTLAKQALSISEKINYTNGIGHSYTYMALYHRANGEYDKVAGYALKMVEVFEQSTNEDGLGQAYNMLGIAHFEWKNYDKAQYYQEKSLEVHRRSGQRYDMSRNYMNLGMVFSETGKHAEAINSFLKALEVNQEFNNEEGIGNAYINLAQAHLRKQDYPSAIRYYEKAFPIAKAKNNKVFIAAIHVGLAEAFSKAGQYNKAIKHADSSLLFAKELKDKLRLRDSYNALAEIEKLRSNFKAALLYRDLAVSYTDSVFSESKLKQIADLEAKYQSEKKGKEIQLLEQKNKTQNLWRNVLIVGLLFTVVVAVIIYMLQQSRTHKAKQLLETQELLNLQMQEADKIKSRFFANISHEFRTPLTLILSPIEEKLLAPDLKEKDKISFQTITRSANRLLELINQILELSKLESGFMKLNKQPGNLYHFIMPVLSSFDSMADVSQAQYSKEVSIPETPVLFDSDKLEKILNNLLSNAFKFSPKAGRVDIKALATENEKSIMLLIEIKNSGSVIPPDSLTKIFDPFFQDPTTSGLGMPGTGLGLSLVKELVKLQEGDIRVTSTAEEGTVFTVTLLFEKSDKEESISRNEKAEVTSYTPETSEMAPSETSTGKDTILIVEDNKDVRTLIRNGLEGYYNIVEASTGKEGLEMAREQNTDLIVSDVIMPVMNGIELCHLLKNDERTSHLPIILLTARADHESKLEGLSTGADDYVIKPFNMQELLARIANLIDQRKRLVHKYNQRIVIQPHEITVTPIDERFILKAIQIIEANLDSTTLSVEKMSEELGMSRTNVHRKLKAITGLATNEFIRDFRLRRAAQLIEKKADTISQIAYQVGFNDQSYFTKCFKKKFGKTPSEYGAHV